jgi:hypothetical protein
MRIRADLSDTEWRRSRRSSAGADCVETAVVEVPVVEVPVVEVPVAEVPVVEVLVVEDPVVRPVPAT